MTEHPSLKKPKETAQPTIHIAEVGMKPQTMQVKLDLSELENKLLHIAEQDAELAAALSMILGLLTDMKEMKKENLQLEREVLEKINRELG